MSVQRFPQKYNLFMMMKWMGGGQQQLIASHQLLMSRDEFNSVPISNQCLGIVSVSHSPPPLTARLA